MKNSLLNRWSLLLLTGGMTLLFLSCSNRPPRGGRGQNEERAQEVDRSINVKTTTVQSGELSSYLDLSGEVFASSAVDVYADTAGKLTSILVNQGDQVTRGQIIAQVDPSRPGMNYGLSPVKAPADGTVTRINLDMGATLSPQAPLLQIGQLDQLEITAQVPERFMSRVELGQQAYLASTAYPGELYQARISHLSPVINPSSRTMEVQLELQEDSPLKPGMFLGIRLTTSTTEEALILREEALIRRNGQTWVYRVLEDRAEKVLVSTGMETDGQVEILSGLFHEDEIVVEGKTLLEDGSKIRVISPLGLFLQDEETNS